MEVLANAVRKANVVFDLGIYDEAYKTVGLKDKRFSHLLFDENVSVKKRIFMTATERQFKGNSHYTSMDDASIYGPIIDQLSFKKAIEQGLLSDYKIVTQGINKVRSHDLIKNNNFIRADGKKYSFNSDATSLASLIALRKVIKGKKLKHAFPFIAVSNVREIFRN